MRIIDVNSKVATFAIGHEGENSATQVRFDYVELFEDTFGPGVCELLFQRPGEDEPYAVPLTLDGGKVIWTVSDTDTDIPGRTGKAVLHYYVGETVAKTCVWMVTVLPSLGAKSENPPEKFEGWVEQVVQIGAEATAARDEIKSLKLVGENVAGREFEIDGNTVVAKNGAEIFNDPTNKATGAFSHAEGYDAEATGYSAHAEGTNCTAEGGYSHAEGQGSTAKGLSAHAEGTVTHATGDYSHTEGFGTHATGKYSHAEGNMARAGGECSHAEGRETWAKGTDQHAQGRYNAVSDKYAHIVGNGTSNSDRSNAHTLDWDGNAWFAGTVEGTGLILTAPNGTKFKITVGNDGSLSAEAI